MKKAIIDLGTNTFHVLIATPHERILKKSIAVKLGAGGIQNNIILPDALERAKKALSEFKAITIEHGVSSSDIYAFGTSAMRNAHNASDLISFAADELDIKIKVIDGAREAELIYKGVNSAVSIEKPSMIIDIGGGSVEFIICNKNESLWKQSFEIGGQRLMQKFMTNDPISSKSLEKMNDFFRESLLPLANACHQYQPSVLIGSSGSFDTLIDMEFQSSEGRETPSDQFSFELSIERFYHWYEELLTKNKEERMLIPGMIPLRVEMIVVAVCLIRYILQTFEIKEIQVSNFALKEGVLNEVFSA